MIEEESLDEGMLFEGEPQVEKKEKEEMVPASVVKDLLDRLDKLENTKPQDSGIENFSSTLAKAIAGANSQKVDDLSGQFKFNAGDFESIDKDDLLEEKDYKTFVAYAAGYAIVDDIVNGIPVRAPLRKIEFTYSSTLRDTVGKEENIVHMCFYTCRSKKELEFLLNHSKFGVRFHDKVKAKSIKDINKFTAQREKWEGLKRKGQHELRSMCKDYGVTFIGDDLDLVRNLLAEKMADIDISAKISAQEQALKDSYMEGQLRKQT